MAVIKYLKILLLIFGIVGGIFFYKEAVKQKILKTTRQEPLQTNCPIRSEPTVISIQNVKNFLGLNVYHRPLTFYKSDFKDNFKGTITDRKTNLMWQEAGSDFPLSFEKAATYIKKLNNDEFAGYSNWRLPTVSEQLSLLQMDKNEKTDLYIHSLFGSEQKWNWSSDKTVSGEHWLVDFFDGSIFWGENTIVSYVRAVRCP